MRGLVEPVAYTATGLRLSDGSTLDVDAVVWCTGFADKDVRSTAEGVLGVTGGNYHEGLLGPKEIAAGLDSTGEARGMWKRHLRVDNYWVIGESSSIIRGGRGRWLSRSGWP